MPSDPVNAVMTILTIPLVIYAGIVAWKVIKKHGPELPRIWRESKK